MDEDPYMTGEGWDEDEEDEFIEEEIEF